MSAVYYRNEMFRAENELGFLMTRLRNTKCQKIEPITEGLKHLQPDACINACTHSLSVLSGGPGTGKTTTLKAICRSFQKAGMKVVVIAPTGAASRRASNVINDGTSNTRISCYTVHTFLGYNPAINKFRKNRFSKIKDVDVIVLDEMSFMGTVMARDFFEAVDHNKTRVIIVGDHNQLPSVQAGNFAQDVISSGVFPGVVLDVVLRTGPNSGIAKNANRIIKGMKLLDKDPDTGEAFTDFFWVKRETGLDAQKYILELMNGKLKDKRGFDSLKDIQVLSPGKAGDIGVKELNKQVQNLLNPHGKKVSSFMRINDKIVNNVNNSEYNIVNGDIGFLRKHYFQYDPEVNDEVNTYELQFSNGSGVTGNGNVKCGADILANCSLAYATTVHKSQGSEYPCVLMPLFCTHYTLLYRNLLYTGMTRAKDLLVLIGESKALNIAIRNNSPSKRVSRLCPILQNAHNYFVTA